MSITNTRFLLFNSDFRDSGTFSQCVYNLPNAVTGGIPITSLKFISAISGVMIIDVTNFLSPTQFTHIINNINNKIKIFNTSNMTVECILADVMLNTANATIATVMTNALAAANVAFGLQLSCTWDDVNFRFTIANSNTIKFGIDVSSFSSVGPIFGLGRTVTNLGSAFTGRRCPNFLTYNPITDEISYYLTSDIARGIDNGITMFSDIAENRGIIGLIRSTVPVIIDNPIVPFIQISQSNLKITEKLQINLEVLSGVPINDGDFPYNFILSVITNETTTETKRMV